jgi:hypothetical protein
MEVPAVDHPAWRDILTGRVRYQLDFFAAKILLGWLLLKVANDPSDDVLVESVEALHHLFAQNSGLPCVQRDLLEIFGDGSPMPAQLIEEVVE